LNPIFGVPRPPPSLPRGGDLRPPSGGFQSAPPGLEKKPVRNQRSISIRGVRSPSVSQGERMGGAAAGQHCEGEPGEGALRGRPKEGGADRLPGWVRLVMSSLGAGGHLRRLGLVVTVSLILLVAVVVAATACFKFTTTRHNRCLISGGGGGFSDPYSGRVFSHSREEMKKWSISGPPIPLPPPAVGNYCGPCVPVFPI